MSILVYKTYLYGGVGNQLFQYFLPYIHSKKYTVSKIFLEAYTAQTSSIDQLLEITDFAYPECNMSSFRKRLVKAGIKITSKVGLSDILGIKTDTSKNLFDDPNASYFGYWQRADLFEPYRAKILAANWRHDIKFLECYNRKDILSDDSFVVHIRKGDYLLNKNQKLFSYLDKNFYLEGLASLSLPIKKIIICTDDLNWVNKNLVYNLSKVCEQVRLSSDYGCQSWVDDFLLMRFSKNLIMSNSTFSWWAAFLNSNNIYFPRQWYNNKKTNLKLNSWNSFGAKK